MRHSYASLTLGILLSFILINESQAQCKGNLIFQDEFDGTTVDATKWTYDQGNGCPDLCGWGNNEKEYYTNSTNNVTVTGGNLNIIARYAPNYNNSGSDFTSGKIHTKGKFDRLYGRFEARMKLPSGTGLWPAFWMLPTDNAYGAWPTSGEIDIMENRGDHVTEADATVHYGSAWPNNQYDGSAYYLTDGTTLANAFHTFAVEWQPGILRFYVDNVLTKTETQTPNSLNPASNNAVNWPWDKRFYIIFNLALGGWFSGNPSTTDIVNGTTWPQTMQVDYVRVYDMTPTSTQTAYLGTTRTIPGKIEAEHYNEGCNGYAYNDVDAGNTGGALRADDVDIEACTDGGAGYDVGWTAAGEWLNYNVNVTTTGRYNIQVRVASEPGAKKMHIEMDGVNVSGNIDIPATGGWTTYQTYTASNIALTAGNKVMKIVFDTDGINVNYVNFALIPNVAPTVSLTAPTAGASFTAPATVTISANAGDSDGSISKVEFYQGTTLLNSDATSPYSYSWTNVAAGTYSITAKAYDNSTGVTTSTAISITVKAPNVAPTVSLTAPTAGATFTAPATVTISANAADSDGSIAKVEFYQGTTLLNSDATSPYSYSWANVSTGTYSITAKAYDNSTGVTTSTPVSITVSNPNVAPTVSLTAPTAGATFTAPATVTISANAADSDGSIAKVEFYQGTTLLNSDATSPYSYSWTNVAAGTYSITAKAYDNSTGVTTSTAISITVKAPNVAPTVSLTAPTAGATFTAPATVTISANAADSDGSIAKVEFYQGTTLLNSDATSPYSYSWANVSTGTYSITAKAYDNSTGVTTSTPVSITVSNPNVAPTVSLTAPTAGATFTAPATVTISANAADSDGSIAKVEFYQGTTLLNSDLTAPYSYSWTDVALGTYSLTAKAYDNSGAVSTSAPVSITVTQTTGVDDNLIEGGLKLYPNPTSGIINFSEDVKKVNISDLTGKILDHIELTDTKQINLSAYASGVYLLKLESATDSAFLKVIKE